MMAAGYAAGYGLTYEKEVTNTDSSTDAEQYSVMENLDVTM